MLFPEKFLETNGKPGQHRGLAWVFYMVRLICMAEAAEKESTQRYMQLR